MAIGPRFPRGQAYKVAADVMLFLDEVTDMYEVAGSIRRQSPTVGDVDIVMIPKPEALKVPNEFGSQPISPWDLRITELIEDSVKEDPNFQVKHGEKMISFKRLGIQVDIYVATEETFECMLLIKTGSANHNTMLASAAQGKNMKLHASGHGLEDLSTNKIIARTEVEILETLVGHYKEPEERN